MNAITDYFASLWDDVVCGWNQFWFTPTAPHTLALVRICAALMLLYTHLVWGLQLSAFLGEKSIVPLDAALLLGSSPSGANYTWSYLWYIDSPTLLWVFHLLGVVAYVALLVGYQSRIAAVASFVFALSYCHRLNGMQFGLDQINAMLVTYLMVSPGAEVLSLDAFFARRSGQKIIANTSWTTIALRLIQLHMCIIYFFGGISKMRGETWWDGSALWFAIANKEYQSLDITWLVDFRWLIAGLTLITFLWEATYPIMIWPRKTRWLTLMMAIFVHGGIALALGMKTFGLAMLIGNLAFVPADVTKQILDKLLGRRETP